MLQAILVISGLNYAGGQITDFVGMNFMDSPLAHVALASGSAVFYMLLLIPVWKKIDITPVQPTPTVA